MIHCGPHQKNEKMLLYVDLDDLSQPESGQLSVNEGMSSKKIVLQTKKSENNKLLNSITEDK